MAASFGGGRMQADQTTSCLTAQERESVLVPVKNLQYLGKGGAGDAPGGKCRKAWKDFEVRCASRVTEP